MDKLSFSLPSCDGAGVAIANEESQGKGQRALTREACGMAPWSITISQVKLILGLGLGLV